MALVNRYAAFNFGDYQYREYPKWVSPVDELGNKKPQVLVEDRDEERLVMRQVKPSVKTIVETSEPSVEAPNDTISDSLEFLRTRADELGVKYSEFWGVIKLQNAIKKAQDAGQV